MANRTIAIGDIHGCVDALRALLDVIRPDSSDTIVTLGDYVDRGPDSAGVIEVLTELISVCTFIPLIGNHEVMMENALLKRRDFEFWIFNGGKATVQSYGGDINNMPMHHRTFLKFCRRFHETDDFLFLHAAYDPDLSMEDQNDELLLWQHVDERFVPEPHYSGKTVICGHTPQSDGDPLDLGHIRILDTFCYGDKWLTAMDVDSGEYIQARTDGMLRPGFASFASSAVAPPSPTPTHVAPAENDSAPAAAGLPTPPPTHLELDGATFRREAGMASNLAGEFLDAISRGPVLREKPSSPQIESWLRELNEPVPESGTDSARLLDQLFTTACQIGFDTTNPGYMAYIPGGGIPDAAIADMAGDVTNRFVTLNQAAPAMAGLEHTVIRWFAQMVGYDEKTAAGFLSSGGSIANQCALVAARVKLTGDDFRLARLYGSTQCHHCLQKAAFMAGFPRSAWRDVPVDADFRMKTEVLERMIETDVSAGYLPLLVVGNAGTTNTGAVDPLTTIREICDRHRCWFHCDAAYGGFFALTASGRKALAGMATADSIVLDPHKGLFLPYGTGCLLVRDRETLRTAFHFDSGYLPPRDDAALPDLCDLSPELSRDNRAIRVWYPLRKHGLGIFRQHLEEKLALARWASAEIETLQATASATDAQIRLEMTAPPQLSLLAFRMVHPDWSDDQTNSVNQRWLEATNRVGNVMLSGTRIDNRYLLRICVLSFRTHRDHVRQAVTDLKSTLPLAVRN